jgi:hypothetical protein
MEEASGQAAATKVSLAEIRRASEDSLTALSTITDAIARLADGRGPVEQHEPGRRGGRRAPDLASGRR